MGVHIFFIFADFRVHTAYFHRQLWETKLQRFAFWASGQNVPILNVILLRSGEGGLRKVEPYPTVAAHKLC